MRAYSELVVGGGAPVGRADEHAWLRAAVTTGGRLVVVSGEAGIGKTHLIRAAVPATDVRAQTSFPSGRFPPPGYGLRRLAAGLAGPHALTAELDGSAADGGAGKELAIWYSADAALRAAGPGVVVLDDLQWADDLTLGWLGHCADLLAEGALTVVAGVRAAGPLPARVEDALLGPGLAGLVDRLVLAPLSLDAVGELAGAAYDAAAVRALYDRTDGLPVAVQEVLRYAGADLPAGQALPLLAALVREQLAALPADARDLIGYAALLRTWTEPALAAITALSPPRFDAALGAALESGLLALGPDGVGFRHEIHREVLADTLGLADRRARHRRIAAVLAGLPDAPAGQLADQYLEAGDPALALDWLERAARAALEAHDYGATLRSVRAALPLAAADHARLKALADLAVLAAVWSNRIHEALAFLDETLADATAPAVRGWLLHGRGRLLGFVGEYEAKPEALEASLAEFRAAGDELGIARTYTELGYPVGNPLPLRTCLAHAEAGLHGLTRVGDGRTVAIAALTLGVAQLFLGLDDRAAWTRAEEALADHSVPLMSHAARSVYTGWAISRVVRGEYAEAARVIDRAEWVRTNTYSNASFEAITAVLRWRTGDWDGALSAAALALDGPRYTQVVVAEMVVAAIQMERERRPATGPLERAAAQLARQRSPAWSPIAEGLLIRLRAARREPRPERGLAALLDEVAGRALAHGWEDLLAASAEVAPAATRRAMVRLGELRPVGPRADAVLRYVDGLIGPRADRTGALLDAADAFAALPEPLHQARALQAAANLSSGRRAVELRVRAATLYRDLGAERSLATLLRSGDTSRALQAFRVPESQSRAAAIGLTKREHEVADLARQGLTVKEIAERLGISFGTARNHLMHVRAKLGGVRKQELTRLLGT